MKNDLRFSIIVPIYKVEELLDRCVKKLLNQTYTNIEIILVDDGSPDRCPEKCDIYAIQDSRVRVIHKKNGGLSDARNSGIEAAKGEYIIFVDSDDFIDERTCEVLLKYIKLSPDIITIDGYAEGTNYNLCHIDSTIVYDSFEYIKKSINENKLPMAAWLYIYKRDFLNTNKLRFKVGVLHEDEQFTPRALLAANSIVNSCFKSYHYIIREGSITTQKDKQKNINDFYDTALELEKIYLNIKDTRLKRMLLNLLCKKYLSLFWECGAYKYGRMYVDKKFVVRCAQSLQLKIKVLLFVISPTLYCKINNLAKSVAH